MGEEGFYRSRQVDRGFFPGIPITRVEQVIVCPYLTLKREGYID
ncbi:hypothetical protein ALC60_11918 [Trachymyrmex zeteki]|uniref:Uncharacterized protein n=1 Tax=Mycetomoellerius zeteki TaxID=64791 RepID=A0A151WLY9_9HYME|nr:hypothetical protein ALC60_11918 [Trachymyrmex zeteki]